MEENGHLHIVAWAVNWYYSVEANVTKFNKIKEYTPFDPSIPTLRNIQKDTYCNSKTFRNSLNINHWNTGQIMVNSYNGFILCGR